MPYHPKPIAFSLSQEDREFFLRQQKNFYDVSRNEVARRAIRALSSTARPQTNTAPAPRLARRSAPVVRDLPKRDAAYRTREACAYMAELRERLANQRRRQAFAWWYTHYPEYALHALYSGAIKL